MTSEREVILVTGARSGIGRFLAEHFLSKGCLVVGISRSESDLVHNSYRHYTADVSDEASVVRIYCDIRSSFGRLDVLINNAGQLSLNHVLTTPAAVVENLMRVNVLGTFICSREGAKLMMPGKNGRIINFTSMAVPLAITGETAYAATKAAVETMTRTMAKELAPFNITCNAVGPTLVQTDMISSIPKEKLAELLKLLPFPRMATFEDVSNVVDFFIRKESSFISGQVLYLGGIPN